MSTATAIADDVAGDAVPKKGKKKLIIILAAVLLLLAVGGGGAAVFIMKKKAAAAAAAAADEDGDGATAVAAEKPKKHDSHKAPTFVPLEPFTVNLADKEADRYAQIGITLEVDDPRFAEELKAYMPAIRNGILMVLSHKTSQQLLRREGKVALAREIMREAVLPLGIEVKDEADGDEDEADDDAPKKNKRKRAGAEHNPVTHVHYSNFIVQ